jgi:hypothetical protein
LQQKTCFILVLQFHYYWFQEIEYQFIKLFVAQVMAEPGFNAIHHENRVLFIVFRLPIGQIEDAEVQNLEVWTIVFCLFERPIQIEIDGQPPRPGAAIKPDGAGHALCFDELANGIMGEAFNQGNVFVKVFHASMFWCLLVGVGHK